MANDLNRVILIGRLTRDPDYKTVGSSALVNFGIANNRSYVAGNEKKEETHYFDCEAWGKLADIIRQYATKGKQVMVEGRLKYDSWDGPDGKKNSRIRVVVENLQLLGTAGSGSKESYPDHRDDQPTSSGAAYPGRSQGSQFDEYQPSDDEPF